MGTKLVWGMQFNSMIGQRRVFYRQDRASMAQGTSLGVGTRVAGYLSTIVYRRAREQARAAEGARQRVGNVCPTGSDAGQRRTCGSLFWSCWLALGAVFGFATRGYHQGSGKVEPAVDGSELAKARVVTQAALYNHSCNNATVYRTQFGSGKLQCFLFWTKQRMQGGEQLVWHYGAQYVVPNRKRNQLSRSSDGKGDRVDVAWEGGVRARRG